MTGQPERIPALDGVRGLAITLVVMMHSAMLFGMPVRGGPSTLTLDYTRYAILGWCGVDVFFVLSGFLITGILVRSKGSPHYFRNFYARRSLRIFPLYYAVIVLLLFVLPRPEASFAEKLPYLLYFQNFTMAGEATADFARHVTWSLAVEEQFYLVWPAVVFLVARRWLLPVCLLVIAASIATRFTLVGMDVANTYYLTPSRLDALVVGAAFALLPRQNAWIGRLLAVGGVVWLVLISNHIGLALPGNKALQGWGIVAALLMSSGLLILARHEGLFARFCQNRVLMSIGRYSYCIYLTHFLVMEGVFALLHGDDLLPASAHQWLAQHVPGTLIMISVTVLYLACAWLVAFASWHVFEKWFLKLKDHFPSAG